MDPREREQQRQANRDKNARRREKKSHTIYAERGEHLRKEFGGAFGKAEPALFNLCAEGTTAIRRAEIDLDKEGDPHGTQN
jgi:hypothetical protein